MLGEVGDYGGVIPEDYAEYPGEYNYDRYMPKHTIIKAGALFPEDCPMESNILKSQSAVYAKSLLKTISTENGTSLYDHLCTIVRQLIDERVPENTADYIEELSGHTKLVRYGVIWKNPESTWKEMTDERLIVSTMLLDTWKQNAMWSLVEPSEAENQQVFQNTLDLQYSLEQINFGFSKEEAYRISLALQQFKENKKVEGMRFWGKLLCSRKNYYVIEVAIAEDTDIDAEAWIPPREVPDDDEFHAVITEAIEQLTFPTLGAEETLERAGKSVTDDTVLAAYLPPQKIPPSDAEAIDGQMTAAFQAMEMAGEDGEYYGEDGGPDMKGTGVKLSPEREAENRRWEMYQRELLAGFPKHVQPPDPPETPMEAQGKGLNRRGFYVNNNLDGNWILLPLVTPQQINCSRTVRWALTGELNAKIQTYPTFPGREANLLRSMLARITCGSLISPKGLYKSTKFLQEQDPDEDESDEDEEDEDEGNWTKKMAARQVFGDDSITLSPFKLPAFNQLLSDSFSWVHHACYILPQGRTTWWNPNTRKLRSEDSEMEEEEEEGEADIEVMKPVKKEKPLPLFYPLSEDFYPDKLKPWTIKGSSEVFSEVQIAGVRSNIWPGAVAFCTQTVKTENMYIGDGQKFFNRNWAPLFTEVLQSEYFVGPELKESPDPPIEIEQSWLDTLLEAERARARANAPPPPEEQEYYYDSNAEDEYDDMDDNLDMEE